MRLRQGPTSRPGPLLPRLHRPGVRPPPGRPGGPWPIARQESPVGVAGARGPVSPRGGPPPTRPAAPHAGPAHVPAASGPDDGIPRPTLRLRRRLGLRLARVRPLLPSPPGPAVAGERAPPRGQPLRAPASLRRLGPAAGQGGRRPKPRERVEAARRRRRITAGRYGGGSRRVEVVTGAGHWSKAGDGLVPIRRVFVHDRKGTHRDESSCTTDPATGAGKVVTRYTESSGSEALQ